MIAKLNNARISPLKTNLIAGLVRRMKVTEALSILKFTPKKGAKVLYKVIASALANATNNFGQKKEDLYLKSIIVNQGTTLKRSMPIARGASHPILKKNSNIIVELGINVKDAKANTKKPKKSDANARIPSAIGGQAANDTNGSY